MLDYWKGEVRRVEEQHNEQNEKFRDQILKEIELKIKQRVEKENFRKL